MLWVTGLVSKEPKYKVLAAQVAEDARRLLSDEDDQEDQGSQRKGKTAHRRRDGLKHVPGAGCLAAASLPGALVLLAEHAVLARPAAAWGDSVCSGSRTADLCCCSCSCKQSAALAARPAGLRTAAHSLLWSDQGWPVQPSAWAG